jgi:hypothetical protein
MKTWHKLLLTTLALWLVVMVILSPRFIEGRHQKQSMDRVFSKYTQALVEQRWDDAYLLSSADFRARTSSQAFVGQHEKLLQNYGKLQFVKQGETVVEGRGSPPRWVAEIHADLRYESKSVSLVYWFRAEGEQWRLVGYRLDE